MHCIYNPFTAHTHAPNNSIEDVKKWNVFATRASIYMTEICVYAVNYHAEMNFLQFGGTFTEKVRSDQPQLNFCIALYVAVEKFIN